VKKKEGRRDGAKKDQDTETFCKQEEYVSITFRKGRTIFTKKRRRRWGKNPSKIMRGKDLRERRTGKGMGGIFSGKTGRLHQLKDQRKKKNVKRP